MESNGSFRTNLTVPCDCYLEAKCDSKCNHTLMSEIVEVSFAWESTTHIFFWVLDSVCFVHYAYQDFEVANVTSCFVIFITIIHTWDDLVGFHLLQSKRHFVYSHMVCVKQNTIMFLLNKLCMLSAESVFNLNPVCVFQSCGVVVGCNGGWEACVGAPPNRRVPAGHDSGHWCGRTHYRTSQSERKGKTSALLPLKFIL